MNPKLLAIGFAAGFVAVLTFHQAVVAIFWSTIGGFAPYPMAPRPPLGVPTIFSLAFWGGVWGILIAAIAQKKPGWRPILIGLGVGAIGCVLVGMTVVPAIRGQALFAGGDITRWIRSIVINGVWGLGAGWLYALMARKAATA